MPPPKKDRDVELVKLWLASYPLYLAMCDPEISKDVLAVQHLTRRYGKLISVNLVDKLVDEIFYQPIDRERP